MKTLSETKITRGMTVLMRVDFDVPVKNCEIQNDWQIVKALTSIEMVLQYGVKLVLMSHLGSPAGNGFEARYSFKPVAEWLERLIDRPVIFGPREVVGPQLDAKIAGMRNGDVLLIENLRFNQAETIPDKAKDNPEGKLTQDQQKLYRDFVSALAKHGDMYVNDTAMVSKHASIYGVPRAVRARGGLAVAGLFIQKEVEHLEEVPGGARSVKQLNCIHDLTHHKAST